VRDALPADRSGGLDLFHCRRARRPRHEIQQQRVRTCDAGLGEQHAAGALLGVRKGDVEAHSASTGSTNLQVEHRLRLPHGFQRDLHVPDQVRQVEDAQVLLDIIERHCAPGRRFAQLRGAVEDVLVSERGCGVHTIDHDLRTPAEQQRSQRGALHRVFRQIAEDIIEQARAGSGVREHVRARVLLHVLRNEDVAPLRTHVDVLKGGLRAQLADSFLRFGAGQATHENGLGRKWRELASHCHADQSGATQQQNRAVLDVHVIRSGVQGSDF
jgi:hypothetical protein